MKSNVNAFALNVVKKNAMIGSEQSEEENEIAATMMSESSREKSSGMIIEDARDLADVGNSFPIARIGLSM